MRYMSRARSRLAGQAGFTLVEMMVSMLVLMIVSGMVLQATVDIVRSNDTMTNVVETERILDEKGIPANQTNIDDIGIGRGATERDRFVIT